MTPGLGGRAPGRGGGRRHVFIFLATIDAGESGEMTQAMTGPGVVTSIDCLFPPGAVFDLRIDPHVRHAGGAVEEMVDTVVPAGVAPYLGLSGPEAHVEADVSVRFDTLDQVHIGYQNSGGVALTFQVKVEVFFDG